MKILAIESSAGPVSACVLDGEKILARAYQNSGLTHSATLLPLTENMLEGAGLSLADIDAFAVPAGPGSFTGLRIGAATAKGLAFGTDRPCIPVSTLLSMAYGRLEWPGVLCAAMDARRGQVYAAAFKTGGDRPERLFPDSALPAAQLYEMVCDPGLPVLLAGDGAELLYGALAEIAARRGGGPDIVLAPAASRFQSADGVALAAAAEGRPIPWQELSVEYLRLPQAERERLERNGQRP